MLVQENKNKMIVSVSHVEEIPALTKEGVSSFLFPLEDYAIGYEKTFTVEEINTIDVPNKIVLLNRLLTSTEIDELEKLLPSLKVDTFMIEDVGLIKLLKSLNKKIILFMNHLNANASSISTWLEYVSEVVVSNELTYEELKSITGSLPNKVVLHIFGYNQVMYSRRNLVKNYLDTYNLPDSKELKLKDKMGLVKFTMRSFDKGTITYSEKLMDGRNLLSLPASHFYVNTSYVDPKVVLDFLQDKEIPSDNGFLEKPTIFKLGAKK